MNTQRFALSQKFKGFGALWDFSTKLHAASTLKPIQTELINIRASQINGCAYCLNVHYKEAKKLGETDQRLALISVWRDTSLFSPQEMALLALTEEITQISNHHVSDAVYNEAAKQFDEKGLADAITSIIEINAWNRLGITGQVIVAPEKE